jgi:hypothetical protein
MKDRPEISNFIGTNSQIMTAKLLGIVICLFDLQKMPVHLKIWKSNLFFINLLDEVCSARDLLDIDMVLDDYRLPV